MAIDPTSPSSEKVKGNIVVLVLLMLALAGGRLWLEQKAQAVPYPYWLAVSENGLAVLYGNRIYVCDNEGHIKQTVPIADDILPCQLSWHGDSLVVADWRNDALQFYRPDGVSSLWLQGGPKIDAHLNAAFDDNAGVIYVTDSAASRLHVYDSAGHYIRSFGETGRARGQLFSPKDLRLRNDALYIGNVGRSGVDVFSKDGSFVRTAVEPKGNMFLNLITDFDIAGDRFATIECDLLFAHCLAASYDGRGELLSTRPQPAGSESVGDIALKGDIVYLSNTVDRTVGTYDAATLDYLGPASSELDALGERDNEIYRRWKGLSFAALIALILCCIPLAFLYVEYVRSRQTAGKGNTTQ